jgi:hypothetical protein
LKFVEATENHAFYDKYSTNSSYISYTKVGKEMSIRSAIKAKISDKLGK